MTPYAEQPIVWRWDDLWMLLGAIVPALLLGGVVTRLGRAFAPTVFKNEAVSVLSFQLIFYLLLLLALYAIVVLRHGSPFWASLGWRLDFPGAWRYLALSPFLAFGLSALGVLLRTPIIESPIQELIVSGASRFIVALFVAILGPLWEELMFRGFLYGLLARYLGPWPGIILSAAPFAVIHGMQNLWAWQPLVIIFVAGLVFGWARYRSGSTAASALVHMGYNSTLLVAFFVQ
jgi:membrane protease YdiL (CAAX protease family)